jgi:hypothetical protein
MATPLRLKKQMLQSLLVSQDRLPDVARQRRMFDEACERE